MIWPQFAILAVLLACLKVNYLSSLTNYFTELKNSTETNLYSIISLYFFSNLGALITHANIVSIVATLVGKHKL